MHAGVKSLLLLFGLLLSEGSAQADPRHVHSFLPSARSANVDDTITAFLAVANAGDTDLERCAIAQEPHGSIIPTPEFREVVEMDENGGLIDGTRFQLFDLGIGQTRRFLVGLRASPGNFNNPFLQTGEVIDYTDRVRIICYDVNSGAPVETTRNDASNFIFRAFNNRTPPDIITIMATPSGDGVIRINPQTGVGVASIAAINIGTSGDFVFRVLPTALVGVRACQSDVNGVCLNPRSDEFSFHLGQNETAFFSIIVDDSTEGRIPFAPDFVRLSIQLNERTDSGLGAIASASVALVDEGDAVDVNQLTGQWRTGRQRPSMTLTLLPDGRYILGSYRIDDLGTSVSLTQIGSYIVDTQADDITITGTADIPLSDGANGFLATVRVDGLMRLTHGNYLDNFRAVLVDNQLPDNAAGTYVNSRQLPPVSDALPRMTISEDGAISGSFIEDQQLFESHGISCNVEGSIHSTVELSQCHSGGTYRAQIFVVEDTRDSSSATIAFLYMENDRNAYRIYLHRTDVN